jgi:hypothetical protein
MGGEPPSSELAALRHALFCCVKKRSSLAGKFPGVTGSWERAVAELSTEAQNRLSCTLTLKVC